MARWVGAKVEARLSLLAMREWSETAGRASGVEKVSHAVRLARGKIGEALIKQQ